MRLVRMSWVVLAPLACIAAARADDPAPAPARAPVAAPTLTSIRAREVPKTDGTASDAVWSEAPETVVDAVLGERRVPVSVRACATPDETWVLCRWSDSFLDEAAGKSDALVLVWGDDVAPDGTLAPAPGDGQSFDASQPSRGDVVDAAGTWLKGTWTVELRRSTVPSKDGAKPRRGALQLSLRDPRSGEGTLVAPAMRVRGAWAPLVRTFDTDALGEPPADLEAALAGTGKPPSWRVRAEESAKNLVLVQESQDDEGDRFPLLTIPDTKFHARDVDLSVRFRAVKGFKDQGAGLVWRVTDAHNHYILRANVLEQNVVCFKMQDNLRVDLPALGHEAGYGIEVAFDPKAWHTLRVVAVGERFEAYLDGRFLFEVVDKTFSQAGGAGLWTKSDSVMAFDDFVASTYDPKVK